MSIKQTLISECSNYTREAKRNDVVRNVSRVLKTNSTRYLSRRGMIDSRHPIYLLATSIRRLYEVGDNEETFLSKVYYDYATITKEAGIVTESNDGRVDQGHYFNVDSLTILSGMRLHPLELPEGDSNIHIISNENKSLLGIAPNVSIDTMQNITSIVINVLGVSRSLYRRYLAGLVYGNDNQEDANDSLFAFVVNGMITSDMLRPYHHRSMFNRYMDVCSGGTLSTEMVETAFVTPNYIPQLNKLQVEASILVDRIDWRSAFSVLPLDEDYTVWDLLLTEADLYAPDNYRWVEVVNELQWAEFYKIVGGNQSGVDSVIRRYLSDLDADAVLRSCQNATVRTYIEERIAFVSELFLR